MTERNIDSAIESRLARLEAENRRLRRVGGAALFGLGSLTLMSFAAPALCDIVWAERFVLRDAQNKTRVTMNAYSTDTPSLVFHDAKGKAMGSVGIAPDGSFKLEMMQNGRSVPASFQADAKGGFRLAKAVERTAAASHPPKPKKATDPAGGVN